MIAARRPEAAAVADLEALRAGRTLRVPINELTERRRQRGV
jgi:hypothetical protein